MAPATTTRFGGHPNAGKLFAAAAFLLLGAVCAVSFMGARKMFRGVPLGSVTAVNQADGAVSVDLGSGDGVMKGISFTVVDEKGGQVSLITPAEVFGDMFWSKGLPPAAAQKVRPGMQVRWLFTPELSLMLQARRQNTPAAWRNFVKTYPGSAFLPELVRGWSDKMLRKVDPEFYKAWKLYTAAAFEAYVENNPAAGLSSAAMAELKLLREYEAEKELERQEREKRAAEYEKESRRQEEIREKALARQQARQMEEMHGKLVNNSSEPVRFVFDPPSILPSTVVRPGEEYEVNHPAGTYTYKVYGVDLEPDTFAFEGDLAEPKPLAEGTADIMFDFWVVEYQ